MSWDVDSSELREALDEVIANPRDAEALAHLKALLDAWIEQHETQDQEGEA